MSSPPKVDLHQLAQNEHLNIEVKRAEDPEERLCRLRREEAEAALQRWKDRWTFITVICVAVIVGGLCLWACLDQTFSSDQQKWATSVVTSMITGFIGYLTGKAGK